MVYGSDLASLTDTVASLYKKEKVKHSVRKKYPKQSHAVMTLNNFDVYDFDFQKKRLVGNNNKILI